MKTETNLTSEKKTLLVLVECKVIKQLQCEGCTEEEAEEDPWPFAVDEVEVDKGTEWQIVDIREWP